MARTPAEPGVRVPARGRPPRLVLRFALFTALGLAAAAAVILVVDRRADTVQAERHAIAQARFAVEAVVKPQLRVADVTGRTRPARRAQLDRLFEQRVLLEGTRAATLYDVRGRATYATRSARAVADRRYVAEALRGVVVSHVATDGSGTRVLQTYVPVVVGSERVRGVALLEREYAPIEAVGRRSSWLVALVLEALLALLFVVFVPLLARVSARIRSQLRELEHIATHDELMGIPNRLGFRRATEAELTAEHGRGAVLLIDLDGFHEINDTIGSERGDVVLALVAERLSSELAEAGLVARLGEDEFGLLLDIGEHERLAAFGERVRRALAPPFEVDGVRVAVDASVGAATFPAHGTDFDTILRRAGVALSIAKTDGRSSDLEVYDPGHDASDVSRLVLAAELREALAAGQLRVHYQPQADLSTRAVRGVEALVRWQHPERGLLTAGTFIHHAERSGLARELGRFVLGSAVAEWRAWQAMGIRLELAVNLSPLDVLDVSLPDDVAALLERHAMPANDLVLEITERTLVNDDGRSRQVLERLLSLGVRMALDDFGTGRSSLDSLRRLPFRQVKLDRSFLAGVPGNAANETIVRSTVEIAHALKATIVAEGIETAAQWSRTAELGCDIAQGYFIGPAVPADEITTRLLGARGAVAAA